MNSIINKLLVYSEIHLGLEKDELIYAANQIIDMLKLDSFKKENVDVEVIKNLETPECLLTELFDLALEKLLINEYEEDMFKTKIMGFLSLNNTEINRNFYRIYQENEEEALEYLYQYGIKNYYIKKDAIDKNIIWYTDEFEDNLKITINLSKPEKDNKDIAKLLTKSPQGQEKYPLCMLCKNNLGYVGKVNYPARQTIRVVNLELDGKPWFMQYSPYAYYYKHCIVINEEHINMNIDENTPPKLFEFLDKFPSFFIGSNASLPIVGGSILNHEHFQGGYERLPLMNAGIRNEYHHKDFNEVKIYDTTWAARTLRLVSHNKQQIIDLFALINNKWNNFTNESINVVSHTDDTPHNTITPIAYLNENKEYVLDIIFRNNRQTKEYPEGIFHVDPKDHNIKKEGIGLIEAMGLFILPGRLKKEIDLMSEIIINNAKIGDYPELEKHRNFIDNILRMRIKINTKEEAIEVIKRQINAVCKNILETISVFKNDDKGNEAYIEFLNSINIR